ncbi:S8 family peptidase [Archangium gephyra]|uniref:S8 family peptidase n=1 Tax=Archangium gephyra TaxID=48 RepID=UPI0035D43DD7
MAKSWQETIHLDDAVDVHYSNQDHSRKFTPILTAVVDDGCDVAHPCLSGLLEEPLSFDPTTQSLLAAKSSHGTLSCGLVSGHPKDLYLGGAAPPDATRLLPVRYNKLSDGIEPEIEMYKTIVNRGVYVISNSFGFGALNNVETLRMREEIDKMAATARDGKGCLFVFAAGNEGRQLEANKTLCSKYTLLVSATLIVPTKQGDITDEGFKTQYKPLFNTRQSQEFKLFRSNHGSGITVCAPGGDVRGLRPVSLANQGTGDEKLHASKNYDYHADTSAACAMVAGVLTLMFAANPSLSALDAKHILCDTADQVDPNCPDDGQWGPAQQKIEIQHRPAIDPRLTIKPYSRWYGFGRVNAAAAVTRAIALRG